MINFDSIPEDLLRILISVVLGALLGIEREYRGKAAGIKTIAMISLGACIFTLISQKISDSSPDRIAANIVTGVGFLGGGVIFKEGFSVTGLTTAASIWIAAAIGMAVGHKDYVVAFSALGLSIFVLSTFEYLRDFIEFFRESRTYRIAFFVELISRDEIETAIKDYSVKCRLVKITRTEGVVEMMYEIYGNEKKLNAFNEWLVGHPQIKSFDF
ncbi:MAG: MgtC/SapB family protein [Bacteroidia bacterium]|nr:MgtC/SapB family protein [Bacteroidia bacterium]